MIIRLYALLMWLVQPLLRLKLARRGRREPGYLEAIDERFGLYPGMAPSGWVWLHAVSLGETRTAAILLAELRRVRPGLRILLTHGTATGRAEGARLLREGDVQVWQPWDSAGAVERFLAHFRPAIGLLMETEVWPQLVHSCARRGVPLLLVNARMSDKSLRQALRLRALALPAFRALTSVLAQTEADARRLRQLDAPVTGVFGNLKFDAVVDASRLQQGRAWRQARGGPVLMLASSREGEEALWLQQWLAQRQRSAPVQWLLVPRHPQRFDEVAALLTAAGLSVSRRSSWVDAPAPADVWLGDTLGDMALYYGMSDVALLGGSFAPLGGQNLIEAAACGCPVILGPHTFNFADAADQALRAGVAWRVDDMAQGVARALQLAGNARLLAESQAACEGFVQTHRGALGKTVAAVLQQLDHT